MTKITVAYCDLAEAEEAGTSLGAQVATDLGGQSPDVAIVFASSKYDYPEFLRALKAACQPKIIIGCSSAGEFTNQSAGHGASSVMAIHSDEMHFSAGLGRSLRVDSQSAAEQLVSSFDGKTKQGYPHRYLLLLADALAGHTDSLVEHVTVLTSGAHQIFGGGAGDDAKFSETHVFFGTEAISDAVVGLEILSHRPLGIGVKHEWEPATESMRVTEADGMRLISLNSIPTLEVFEEHASKTGQRFDKANPVPFFLHNTLGIKTHEGYKLRVALSVGERGSIHCASDVPVGSLVSIMKASATSSVDATEVAVKSAIAQMQGRKATAALFFDCVATRLRMGNDFALELESLGKSLGNNVKYAGCNSYGQIARVDGQFSGFHNCTAVVCVFPE